MCMHIPLYWFWSTSVLPERENPNELIDVRLDIWLTTLDPLIR